MQEPIEVQADLKVGNQMQKLGSMEAAQQEWKALVNEGVLGILHSENWSLNPSRDLELHR